MIFAVKFQNRDLMTSPILLTTYMRLRFGNQSYTFLL